MNFINIICSDGISGHEKPILELHNFFKNKNINSEFFFLTRNPNITDIFEIKQIPQKNINIIFYNSLFSLFKSINNLLENYNNSIIHSHLTKADIICSLLKTHKFKNLKLISTRPYDYSFDFFHLFFYRSIYKFFSNFNYQISISDNISNLIINEGFDKNKISRIYYGSKIPSDLKNKVYFDKRSIQISVVARFLKWKNHIKIIDHFKSIDFKKFIIGNNIKFVFYGNGPLDYFLKKKIEDNKLSKFISIRRNILQQNKIYKDTDILLHPSKFEGFGLVATEAISYKKPVICNTSIGMSYIIKKISRKLVIDVNSYKQLIDSIKYTINNYNKLSDSSFIFFKKNLTYEKMANGYIKIYKKCK